MQRALGAPRRRHNDGQRSTLVRALPIDERLMAKLIAEFHEPLQRKAPRVFHGPKAFHGGCPKSEISDEQVLAIRRMREHAGMSLAAISEATGLKPGTVYGLCSYRNRAHLDPGPRPAPDFTPGALDGAQARAAQGVAADFERFFRAQVGNRPGMLEGPFYTDGSTMRLPKKMSKGSGAPSHCWLCGRQLQRAPGRGLGRTSAAAR